VKDMAWEIETILRLVIAAVLGGIIGLEREALNKAAGFRTHTLVSVGSCLIMVVSISMHNEYGAVTNADPGRIAAQVVSGIGFLGAGTILRSGPTVRGLTTAATLWVVAGIGLAVGSGAYLAAVSTTFIVFFALTFLAKLEDRITARKKLQNIVVTMADQPGQIGLVCSVLGNLNINIKNIELAKEKTDEANVQVQLCVKLPTGLAWEKVIAALENLEGVSDVKFT